VINATGGLQESPFSADKLMEAGLETDPFIPDEDISPFSDPYPGGVTGWRDEVQKILDCYCAFAIGTLYGADIRSNSLKSAAFSLSPMRLK
jgi:hypothetical protein